LPYNKDRSWWSSVNLFISTWQKLISGIETNSSIRIASSKN
jgi:hypothetical protein